VQKVAKKKVAAAMPVKTEQTEPVEQQLDMFEHNCYVEVNDTVV
jgi:hypothetical protein